MPGKKFPVWVAFGQASFGRFKVATGAIFRAYAQRVYEISYVCPSVWPPYQDLAREGGLRCCQTGVLTPHPTLQ